MEFDIVSTEPLMEPSYDGTVARLLDRTVTEHSDGLVPYKHPRLVDICDALPKTGSGKIRKMALREAAVLEERGIEP